MPEKYLYKDKVLQRKEVEYAAKQSGMDIDTYSQKAGLKRVNDNYSYNGKTISAEDVFDAAKQSGIGFDDYIQKAKITALPDEKKNLGGNVSGTQSSPTQSQLNVEIPTVSLEDNNSQDAFTLSKKHNELSNKSIEVGDTETGTFYEPDKQSQKQAADLKDFMVNAKGIDPVDVYEEIKDVPEDKLQKHKNELLEDRETNNPLYQRKLARFKWEDGMQKELIKGLEQGGVTPDEYNAVRNHMDMISEETGQGDYTNQREAVKSLAKDIQLYGGENKDKLLKDFAVEVSKVYGNAYNNNLEKTLTGTPESKYLDNDEQLGLQFLKDVAPDKAGQYDRLMLDPKTYKDNPDAVKGANHLHQTLAETGLGLQQNSVTEELNSLKKQADLNNGLTPEQLQKATELETKQQEINQKQKELDKKYPDRIENKVDDAVQEILGQRANYLGYLHGKAVTGVTNTIQGIWEAVSSPFMSDASNTIRELGIMGQSLKDEYTFHKTDVNKNLLTDQLVIQPELQAQIDGIKNNKFLNDQQKEVKLSELLKNNLDKFGRVPIQNGKFNINPSSILYGLTDLGTSLLPFVALEAATSGIGGVSTAAKFLRTFTAAAATTFHDEYAQAIMDGKPQSEAYKSAMGITAINSLAMAGAATPTEIRAMAGSKSSASKIIAQMSDKAIQDVLDKGVPKGLKSIGQAIKDRAKATPAMIGQGLKTGAKFEGYMAGANLINDREVNGKQMLLGIGNFGIMGAGLGHIGYKSPTEMQKGALLSFGEKPDEFRSELDNMKKEGLSQAEYDHRLNLIDRAEEAYKTIPKANAKGNPLPEKEKAEYLYNTVIKNEGKKAASNLPPKQAEKAEITAMAADHANDLILEPKTDKQLESRKSALEVQLEKKDENGKLELTDTERKDAKAELQAVNDAIERNKNNVVVEPPKEVPESIPLKTNEETAQENGISVEPPMQIPEPITIGNENTQASPESTEPVTTEEGSTTAPAVSEDAQQTGTGEENVTGVKKVITDETRAANGMPKVTFPKMSSDVDALNAAKERVDNGQVNPQEMVDRILKDKSNYKDENEVMDMQYYAHQLQKRNTELNEQLASAETPEAKLDIVNQKMQLSDLIDAQTEAAQTAGNQWGKTGNRMQPVINDAGQIFRENKNLIKEAYGGEVPKEVQAKLDALTKERDEAIAAKVKVEEQLKQKMAQKGFEEIKKRAAKSAKTKETAEQLKKEEQDLLQQLKDAGKADPTSPKRSGAALTDKHVVIIGKLALNYFKQGINGLEAIINKIHDAVINDIPNLTRKDIRDLLANYDPLTIEKEIERLNKKADLLENKLTPPSVDSKGKPTEKTDFAKPSKIDRTFRNNSEWTKANQRVANAEHQMKIEKRKAFESKKNLYQKGLMWLGRLTRLSVLSGKAVLAKLAAAAVIGGAGKRLPEQAIGGIYGMAFKGIAEKAPIEGYWNAKSEAKFYKEFFDPKKFAKNSWEILKSGSTDLGKRLGGAEYEHVPILYLPTDLHQIIKDPLKRAAYEASLRNGLVWAEKQWLDINDPLVINSLENAAYKRGQYEIFQESNKLSRWFVSQKAALEKKGNAGATVKFVVDFMIPVSTVPANIVRRAATTSPVGMVRGTVKVIDAYRKGLENLSTEEAESIMKQLKQGTLGTALWLAGWFGYQSFGGLYSQFNPNKKREEGDKMSDVMVVNGEEIPKPVQHALPLEVIQVAATARRIYENYRKNKNASTPEALLNAGLGSIGALGEQIPVIETPIHAVMATQDPQEFDKLKEDIDRRIVPQIIREGTDKTKGSDDLKYLDDHQLKIVDIHKESLHPVNSKGDTIFVTPQLFKKVTDVREEKIKKEVSDARKHGFVIWETGEKIPADKITTNQLRSWLMGVSTKAKNEAINEVFGEQPEKEDKPKVETYQ